MPLVFWQSDASPHPTVNHFEFKSLDLRQRVLRVVQELRLHRDVLALDLSDARTHLISILLRHRLTKRVLNRFPIFQLLQSLLSLL